MLLNVKVLLQIDPKQSKRILEVCANPELKWAQQYRIMQEKMHEAMSRLRSTRILVAN